MVSTHLRWHHPRYASTHEGLSLHRGYDQSSDQLGESPAVDDAGQAVFCLFCYRSRARSAPRAQGGRFGGWALYMKDGKPIYTYNFLGLERFTVASPTAVPAGKATIVLDFVYDGGGLGKGGKAILSVDGKKVAEGRIEKTQALIFSADETADVGLDNQTPVAEGIGIGRDETRFTGKIKKITLKVKDVK